MAYVAVKGGKIAIEQSILRLKQERLRSGKAASVKTIENSMRLLVDQVMSEGSIYCPSLAALAIKQAEGSMEEAVFLLRAYRSTLPRRYYSTTVESADMQIERRISAAFKDIPGGQILGTSYDYTHRLLDFDLLEESDEQIQKILQQFKEADTDTIIAPESMQMPKVTDYLRSQGFIDPIESDDSEPKDATKETLTFPCPRSMRLQILTRGMTQAVTALGYASLRGYGVAHPTVCELRVGRLPITIADPANGDDEENEYVIGEIKVTEVESLIPVTRRTEDGRKQISFEIGYGIAAGQNETKAIAMSILDQCLMHPESSFATSDEEFVLYHVDSIEATGFISHLKLPHYVTFQAKLNSARKVREEKA